MVTTTFSDRKMETDDYLDTTDGRVVESWLMTARHTGEASARTLDYIQG